MMLYDPLNRHKHYTRDVSMSEVNLIVDYINRMEVDYTEMQRKLTEARKDAERYRWLKECTNEQFEYLEKEWCGLDNAIDCLMAVERKP